MVMQRLQAGIFRVLRSWGLRRSGPTQYHQQDSDTFCGAACAQMILSGLGRRVTADFDQLDLQRVISKASPWSDWEADPLGLRSTLDKPPASGSTGTTFNHGVKFSEVGESNKDTLSRKIVWSLYQYNTSPVVLVWGKRHWLLVSEYDLENNAKPDPSSAAYTIKGLMIYNPAPAVEWPAGCRQTAHGPSDSCGRGYLPAPACGIGKSVNRAVKNHHVSYVGWVSSYLTTPLELGAGEKDAQGKYLVLKDKYVFVCRDEVADAIVASANAPVYTTPGDPRVNGLQAVDAAWQGMIHHNLQQRGIWRQVLVSSTTAPPHRFAVPVYREDTKKYYFIVPFYINDIRDQSENLIAAIVDGHSRGGAAPEYLESIAVPKGPAVAQFDLNLLSVIGEPVPVLGERLPGHLPTETVLGQTLEFPGIGPIELKEEYLDPHPITWEPCLESLTPFDPFYTFTNPRGTGQRLYVRASDHRPLATLQTDIKGGGLSI